MLRKLLIGAINKRRNDGLHFSIRTKDSQQRPRQCWIRLSQQ